MIFRSKEQNKTRKKQRVRPYLPEELIINDILIRLPARTLAICSCVSKLWYNSIFHDPKFTSSHFVENKNKLKLVFNLLNVFENGLEKAYFLSIEEKISKNTDFYYHKVLADISFENPSDGLVGYCNGLVCLNLVTEIAIINPSRGERLVFPNCFPMGCMYLCDGFGFDSSLQEYKVVFVYTTTTNEEKEEKLVCMVITLGGENSWREIVTSTAKISLPPGSSPLPSRMVTSPSSTHRSATLCGGDMFWRITYTGDNNDESDMLLSFNIHNEKFQFIRLPHECCQTHTATTIIDEHQCLVVDHHLLEFQGDLCVARTEKIMIRNSSDRHLQHRNHHCKGQEIFCCCGFKVHLYIMNDKVKQVWTKGNTFSFPLKDGLLPDPFCCYFDKITFVTPPTRMLSYSGQLFLYWFDGLYLLIYGLQMVDTMVVECFSSRDDRIRGIFDAKIKGVVRSPGPYFGLDDNKFFPYTDYQLQAQVENIISMKNFIPAGLKTSTFSYHNDFE